MPLTQEQPILSGNLVIDGTLEAKHIKANTITANKFSGAVEEEYWAYNDDVDVSWSTSVFTTAHTFNFPATELEIKKGRHVHWSAEGFQNTATSSIQSGSFYFQFIFVVAGYPRCGPRVLHLGGMGPPTAMSWISTLVDLITSYSQSSNTWGRATKQQRIQKGT